MIVEMKKLFDSIVALPWTPEEKGLFGLLGIFFGAQALGAVGFPGSLLPYLSWSPFKKEGLKLGKYYLTDFDRVRHCHIVGPPGSGKTELTKLLCFEDIKKGRGCFIVDPKGDRELYDEVGAFCKTVGREGDLRLLSATYPEESCNWNPCGLGNASELQSKFLNANTYAEPHFAKACESGLLDSFNRLMEKTPTGFGLLDLVRELKALADEKKSKDLAGLFYDFESISKSEWAPILCCGDISARKELSLLDVVLKNQILFVHLPTEGKSVQSARIGRLLTQEIILISGLRKSYPDLNRHGVFSIYIDEFDAFATDSFVTFLNKGRSSNFMIHIAHQTLSDLRKISEEFAGQILGNCNTHIVFRNDDPDEAEFWARFMGTKTVVKRTYQTQDGSKTGASSNRESQEFLISPDEIKSLEVGQCILSVKTQKISSKIRLPLCPQFNRGGPKASTVAMEKRVRGSTAVKPEPPTAINPIQTRLQEESQAQPDQWKHLFQPQDQQPGG